MLTQLTLPFVAHLEPTRRESRRGVRTRGVLIVGRREWVVTFVRHHRARHYVLRVEDDGGLRVTIPRGGSRRDAERFAKRKAEWIERERDRRTLMRRDSGAWTNGSPVLLRGESLRLEVDEAAGVARLGEEQIPLPTGPVGNLRPRVTEWLRKRAQRELPPRLMALASSLGQDLSRVTVRDQRSRWGSCSPAGRISLNWRLIQTPPSVRDYVLLHELTHMQEANHSGRFWQKLEAVCPWHRDARAWLRSPPSLGPGLES